MNPGWFEGLIMILSLMIVFEILNYFMEKEEKKPVKIAKNPKFNDIYAKNN